DLDDIAVLHCFKIWRGSEDAVLAQLCRGLLYRELFKSADLTRIADPSRVAEIREAAADAIEAAGAEPAYAMFYDEPADTPYEIDHSDPAGGAEQILIRDAGGTLTDFASLSPMSRALARQLMFRRL